MITCFGFSTDLVGHGGGDKWGVGIVTAPCYIKGAAVAPHCLLTIGKDSWQSRTCLGCLAGL